MQSAKAEESHVFLRSRPDCAFRKIPACFCWIIFKGQPQLVELQQSEGDINRNNERQHLSRSDQSHRQREANGGT